MLEIAPLRAIRYAESQPERLSALIAPPYDVISPSQRERLAARDPHNVVQLILPQERAGDGATDNKYVRAGKAYHQWISEGLLRADPEPAVYALHQRFEWGGKPMLRKGFLARLRLREFSEGVVLPHERTLSGPKADRLEIVKQARANLSPIFSLYSEEDGSAGRRAEAAGPKHPIDDRTEIDALFAPAIDRAPDARAESDDGHGAIQHQLWRLTDPKLIAALRAAMAPRRAYIADGHHRYETALNYARWVDAEHGKPRPQGAHHYVLSYFCGMADPGLLILPTHRLLHDLKTFDLDRFLLLSDEFFNVERLPADALSAAGLSAALRRLAESGRDRHSFLLVGDRGKQAIVLRLKSTANLLEVPELPKQSDVRALDVTVLHGLLLQHVLGLSPASQERQENLRYVKDAPEAVAAVASGSAQAAFLVNPTLMGQVRSVAEAGEVMPQKSTFFYPKLPSGLVFNPLDPDEKV